MPAKELFTVYGYSSNAQTSGEFALVSDAWNGAVEIIRLPLGCVFKVWEERIDGPPTDVYFEVSYDTGSTYTVMGHIDNQPQAGRGLWSGSIVSAEKQIVRGARPSHILNSDTSSNTKIVKWRFEQPVASTALLTVNCEITSEV